VEQEGEYDNEFEEQVACADNARIRSANFKEEIEGSEKRDPPPMTTTSASAFSRTETPVARDSRLTAEKLALHSVISPHDSVSQIGLDKNAGAAAIGADNDNGNDGKENSKKRKAKSTVVVAAVPSMSGQTLDDVQFTQWKKDVGAGVVAMTIGLQDRKGPLARLESLLKKAGPEGEHDTTLKTANIKKEVNRLLLLTNRIYRPGKGVPCELKNAKPVA